MGAAAFPQKVQVANILSRELGGDSWKFVQCLNKIFADPAHAKTILRDAAQQGNAQQEAGAVPWRRKEGRDMGELRGDRAGDLKA